MDDLIIQYAYVGIVLLLVMGTVGFPVPEDLVLISAGAVAYAGKLDPLGAWATCYVTIFVIDAAVFGLGLYFGSRALRWKMVRKMMHPRRMAWAKIKVAEYGVWMIAACRFVPGLRGPTLILGGAMKLSVWKFILSEAPALFVCTVIEFFLGWIAIGHLAGSSAEAKRLALITFLSLFCLLVVVLVAWKFLAPHLPVADKSSR